MVPPQGYLQRLRRIADAHGILLIFDEVITGFGRTGRPFAAQSFGVTPDIITMAKALTNGTVPMGAVASFVLSTAADQEAHRHPMPYVERTYLRLSGDDWRRGKRLKEVVRLWAGRTPSVAKDECLMDKFIVLGLR